MPAKTAGSLENKVILVVDDEPDILDTVSDLLSGCHITTADTYETARQYLMSYTYDLVLLDIMGVNGFDLLKIAVKRGFPTVMMTAHALTPAALEKAIRLGAVSFLPKEKLGQLKELLSDVVNGGNRPAWATLFKKLGQFFNIRFGSDWRTRNRFLKEFEEALNRQKSGSEP
jgi:DNA-binding NtrC family response regulator